MGRNAEISALEVLAVLQVDKIHFEVEVFGPQILLLSFSEEQDSRLLIAKLGGTVKIVQIFGREDSADVAGFLERQIHSQSGLEQLIKQAKGKVHFGISYYDLANRKRADRFFGKSGLRMLKLIKALLKARNMPSGFLRPKEACLSSVSVEKNKLLKEGFEMVIVFDAGGFYWGKTLAVQPFEEFSFRDYGRPDRDDRSGMLPPKLARIMINLVGVEKEASLLDPFCGSGTILQEALLLGYRKLAGADINPLAISHTKQNLNWLKSRYPKLPIEHIGLYCSNVADLDLMLKSQNIDAIVTEPFLGSADISRMERVKLMDEMREVKKLYLSAFSTFARLLRVDGKLLVVFPVYRHRGGMVELNLGRETQELGLKMVELRPQTFIGREMAGFKSRARGSLLYGREGQTVWREIFLFVKT